MCRAPSWLTIGIYYAVLVGAWSGWLFAPARRVWSMAILLLIAALYFWRWEHSRVEIELTVLPLNGGHAVCVDAAGRKNDWLINCGNDGCRGVHPQTISPRPGREQNPATRFDGR